MVDRQKAKGQYFQIPTTFKIPRGVHKDAYLHALSKMDGMRAINEL